MNSLVQSSRLRMLGRFPNLNLCLYILHVLPLGYCVDPPDIPNAVRKTNVGTLIPAGMVIKYGCHPGYEMIAGISQGHVTCLENSTWSSAPNFCQICAQPLNISHGQYNDWGKRVFFVGSSVTYKCDRGYSLVGKASIQCIAGDEVTPTWSEPTPQCEACGRPPTLMNGLHNGGMKEYFPYESQVTYSCGDSLSLIGESSIYCTTDGVNMMWSGPAPQCKGKSFPMTLNYKGPHGIVSTIGAAGFPCMQEMLNMYSLAGASGDL
uniref:Sushi domain-containing protein n=1 Tax=Chrysemys picta bellii TaxID=8478 RepID=A0A8C3F8W8_CHRPI